MCLSCWRNTDTFWPLGLGKSILLWESNWSKTVCLWGRCWETLTPRHRQRNIAAEGETEAKIFCPFEEEQETCLCPGSCTAQKQRLATAGMLRNPWPQGSGTGALPKTDTGPGQWRKTLYSYEQPCTETQTIEVHPLCRSKSIGKDLLCDTGVQGQLKAEGTEWILRKLLWHIRL